MFPLPILERYLGGEILRIFIVILGILTLILIGGSLVKILKLAAGGAISPDSVGVLILLEILRLSGRLIPAAFFFAVVVVLGRFWQDQEMIALQASGVGFNKIRKIILLVALPLFLISLWAISWLYPIAGRISDNIKTQHQEAVLVSAMDSGRFYEARKGNLVFYAESSNNTDNKLNNLFIYQKLEDGDLIATASQGHHELDEETGLRRIILQNGYEYKGIAGIKEVSRVVFDEYSLLINIDEQLKQKQRLATQNTLDLFFTDELRSIAELQSRLLYPLSVIFFGLLAVPLSRSSPRRGVYLALVLAILFYIIFSSLIKSSEQWMSSGSTPKWIGLWWVLGLMLMTTVLLDIPSRLAFYRRR